MKKYLRTDHGTSTQYIQKTPENNIGGIGQGAGNGPQGSNCQTGLLKTVHGKMRPGMNITHPNHTDNISIDGPGFIDDQIDTATLPSQTLQDNIQLITPILQSWQNLLNTTGGDLSLTKCSFKYYHTTSPQQPLETTESPSIPRTRTQEKYLFKPGNQRNLSTTLNRLEPNTPEKHLGVHINMEGTWKFEHSRRTTQFKEVAQKISVAKMTRIDAYLIYQVIQKSLDIFPPPYTLDGHTMRRNPATLHPCHPTKNGNQQIHETRRNILTREVRRNNPCGCKN